VQEASIWIVKQGQPKSKPELIVLVSLEASLTELQELADSETCDGKLSELARKLGQPFLIGDTIQRIVKNGEDDRVGQVISARGGTNDIHHLMSTAFGENTNAILGVGIALMLVNAYHPQLHV